MFHRRGRGAPLLRSLSTLTLVLGILAFPALVYAADEASPPPDFRGKVMLGFTLVFVIIIIYLIISHRRNARLGEEIEFLSRRVAELDKPRESVPR